MTPFHFSRFTWDAPSRAFVAELSDLGPNPLERIFPDACDVGLAISGVVRDVRFYVDEERRDVDGNLESIVLRPVSADERYAPGVRVILFND